MSYFIADIGLTQDAKFYMNRLDRALGILLLLRKGATVSATDLAAHFEVSIRTIYRDIAALGELGVPIYAEMGREGGFRLVEGYFLPPIMLSTNEAISLLLGLTLLRRLRVTPFPKEIETAEHKLLAALPDHLRNILTKAAQLIGFEALPADIFHGEPQTEATPLADSTAVQTQEGLMVGQFLRAIFEEKRIRLHYRSPYRRQTSQKWVTPIGLLWDRDWWYLVGRPVDDEATVRLWRADRVLAIEQRPGHALPHPDFDVNQLLGRTWLQKAMNEWREEAPVKLQITPEQAQLLQKDWYYRYAQFEELENGQVSMSFGEDNPQRVFELVRWLGPGAALIEPRAWQAQLRNELSAMLAMYPTKVDR